MALPLLIISLCVYLKGSAYVHGFLTAGHSLGGALATLAAYDIQKELTKQGQQQQQQVEVVCYSFGAPRTGNHAFARDYNHVVPDTWSIINDQVQISGCCFSCAVFGQIGHRLRVLCPCFDVLGELCVNSKFHNEALEPKLLLYLGADLLVFLLKGNCCHSSSRP